MDTVAFKAGDAILTEGAEGNSAYLIVSGSVEVSVRHGSTPKILATLNAGEVFGEIALLDGRPRTAEALALSDCELMIIDRRDFVPLVKSQPDIALKIIEVLCARLRRTSEQVEDVIFLDLPGRLAKTLLRLAEHAKSSAQGRKVAITQKEIGQIIGMSRESTNKQLREWEERRWVRLERGGIVVVTPEKLVEIAAGDTFDGN